MLDQINKMAVQAQRAAERSGSRSQSRKRSYKPKRYKTVDRTRNKYNVKLNKNLAPISETINSMLFTSSNYRSSIASGKRVITGRGNDEQSFGSIPPVNPKG